MAKSKAKKYRDHIFRTTNRDISSSRGIQVEISTHVRKTKSKKEKWKQDQTKHKKRTLQNYQEGDAFLFYLQLCTP